MLLWLRFCLMNVEVVMSSRSRFLASARGSVLLAGCDGSVASGAYLVKTSVGGDIYLHGVLLDSISYDPQSNVTRTLPTLHRSVVVAPPASFSVSVEPHHQGTCGGMSPAVALLELDDASDAYNEDTYAVVI